MDKFMSSTWFMRGASLVIAVLLFTSVNFEFKSDRKVLEFSTSPEINSVTIENVPVEVYYDTENLVVSGIPDSVDVTLKGAKSLLTAAKNQRDFTVYLDLSDPNITLGKRTATFKIANLNEKLIATIDPEYVEVKIQEKVTKEFSIDAEYNHSVLEDGYLAEDPVVEPRMVKVTGAKEIIDQISYVKAIIDLDNGVNETVTREATVQALDRNLNKLDVIVEPASVDVTLKVSIPDKKVKITPVQKGKLKDGLAIKSMSVEPKDITIYGKQEELDKIDEIDLDVDVTNVTGDTEVELNLPKTENVKGMSARTVKVRIDIEKEGDIETETDTEEVAISSKKLNDLLIGINGSEKNQRVEIEPIQTDITLFGKSQDLEDITSSDIELSVDVSQLTEGKHEVEVSVKAPSSIEWELSSPIATVSISGEKTT